LYKFIISVIEDIISFLMIKADDWNKFTKIIIPDIISFIK